eukprot:TRINITY_DN67697_c0_g1_i1.p1 TRINITY_DN67697_c0_g1~~TRINITY_DN67697_c0_g1_i1.p1  ORF type:complete len:480 (+),score=88.68 TRINITY_DN67697_c0_g1_i1:50-1441(+)
MERSGAITRAEEEQQKPAERYQLLQQLGMGTFGTVWRAVDRQSGMAVAVKRMSKAELNAGGGKPCFNLAREPVMMRACVHENIARIHACYEDDQSLFLAMELCEGGDLGSRVLGKNCHQPPAEQLAKWAREMCSAVAALHGKRICHRDLKPSNFLLTRAALLKLSDFGLAVFLPDGQVLKQRCGTIPFMSPEIYRLPRSKGYSFPADAWATGLCIYMLGVRQHPFHSKNTLDEAALLNGWLGFGSGSYLESFVKRLQGGMGGAAPKEDLCDCPDFRQLCLSLVHADEAQRLSAAGALAKDAWLASVASCRERAPQTRLQPTQVTPVPGPRTILIDSGSAPGSREASVAGTAEKLYSPRDVFAYPRLKLGKAPARTAQSSKQSALAAPLRKAGPPVISREPPQEQDVSKEEPQRPCDEAQGQQDLMSWLWAAAEASWSSSQPVSKASQHVSKANLAASSLLASN